MSEIIIKPEVTAMADKIVDLVSIDKKTGISTPAADLYKTLLPDDLSVEHVLKVRDHDTTFVAATVLAHGSLSKAVMTKNKELDSTNLNIDMLAKSGVTVEYKRQQDFPNMKEKGGTPITKFGTTTVEVHHAAGHNAGELKKVRNFLKEEALKAFGTTETAKA